MESLEVVRKFTVCLQGHEQHHSAAPCTEHTLVWFVGEMVVVVEIVREVCSREELLQHCSSL